MDKFPHFPAWRYGVDGARVFDSQAELDAHIGEWFKHPDEVTEKVEDSKPKRGRPAKS